MTRQLAFITVVLAGAAGTAAAQAKVTTTMASYSGYVFRGVTLSSRPVLEPTAALTIPAGKVTFTATGWANVEAGRYNGPTDLSEGGGAASWDVTEFDWIAEAATTTGKATWALGAIGYVFPNPAAKSPVFNPSLNTLEFYAKVALEGPLAPTAAVYYDVRKIKGAYFEGTLTRNIPLSKTMPLTLGALAGFTAGQDAELGPDGLPTVAFFTFARNGLTHVDLSAAVPVTVGGMTFAPAIHAVYGNDPYAKLIAVGRERDFKLWAGASIAWTQLFKSSAARVVAAKENGGSEEPPKH